MNGFAEAVPTRAKQGKDSHMILFSKEDAKKFLKKIVIQGVLYLTQRQIYV